MHVHISNNDDLFYMDFWQKEDNYKIASTGQGEKKKISSSSELLHL